MIVHCYASLPEVTGSLFSLAAFTYVVCECLYFTSNESIHCTYLQLHLMLSRILASKLLAACLARMLSKAAHHNASASAVSAQQR